MFSVSVSWSVLSQWIRFTYNSMVSVVSIPGGSLVVSNVDWFWLISRWCLGVLLLVLSNMIWWIVLIWWLGVVSWSILISIFSLSRTTTGSFYIIIIGFVNRIILRSIVVLVSTAIVRILAIAVVWTIGYSAFRMVSIYFEGLSINDFYFKMSSYF